MASFELGKEVGKDVRKKNSKCPGGLRVFPLPHAPDKTKKHLSLDYLSFYL